MFNLTRVADMGFVRHYTDCAAIYFVANTASSQKSDGRFPMRGDVALTNRIFVTLSSIGQSMVELGAKTLAPPK